MYGEERLNGVEVIERLRREGNLKIWRPIAKFEQGLFQVDEAFHEGATAIGIMHEAFSADFAEITYAMKAEEKTINGIKVFFLNEFRSRTYII